MADREKTRLALLDIVIGAGEGSIRAAYLLADEYDPPDFDTYVRRCFPKGIVSPAAFEALADAWELRAIGASIASVPTYAGAR